MSLRTPTSARALAARRDRILEAAEDELSEAAGAAIRQLLRRITARLTPSALTAAATDIPRSVNLFTLGEAAAWWDEAVDEHVTAAVRSTFRTGWADTSTAAPAAAGAEDYLAAAKDRLSRTAEPAIPAQAYDRIRIALADELADGSGMQQISRRLAAEMSWDEDARFWRDRKTDLDGRIDGILDPIGPPGDPAREAARKADPEVRALQARRAEAVKRIDRVQSGWQNRATTIARTESVGAWNVGALEAGLAEDAGVKRWLATPGPRTRTSHLFADGQCVPVREPFRVGGASMMAPGDPTAPAAEVINCRAVLPGTLIAGVVLMAMKRRWHGPTCFIYTASGHKLAATPEHPVLTLRGWLRADEVQPGDQCVRYRTGVESAGQPRAVLRQWSPHVGDDMPRVEEVYEAASLAATRGQGRRGGASDLDEQGVGIDVDCVSLHDPLTVGGDTAFAQRLGDFGVAASRREMCVSRDPMTLVRVTQPDTHRLAASPRFVPDLGEPGCEHGARHAEVTGDRLDGFAGLVPSDHGLHVDVMARSGPTQSVRGAAVTEAARPPQPGKHPSVGAADMVRDLLDAHARVVEASEVVVVRDGWFDGHVYDLQTAGGTYLASGLIVHNCTVVFARDCEESAEMYDAVDERMDAERTRRAEQAAEKGRPTETVEQPPPHPTPDETQ